MNRTIIHNIYTILFKKERKKTMKIYAGQAKAYSSGFSAVYFFSFLNPLGAANFYAYLLKYSSKILHAQNG